MLKVLIVDDEENARKTLANFIQKYCTNVELCGECSGVKEAAETIEKSHPDVLLLDIRMADGTGFDLLDRISRGKTEVVFTTAYDEYAIKAIRYSAADYLLKPIDPAELVQAIHKAVQRKQNGTTELSQNTLGALLNNLKNPANARLAIPDGKGITYVDPADIIVIRSSDNFCIFSIKGRDELVVTRALKDFEEMLSGEGFFRIHNTCMINFDHVLRYVKGEGGGAVEMSNNTRHEVARRRKDEFLEMLSERSRG